MSRQGFICGNVEIELLNSLEFVEFTFDPSTELYNLTLTPTSEEQVGGYYLLFEAYLVDY